jgi:hypothetical protein
MPYQEMPLEEFRGLVDAVKNIEHLGRLKHKLLTRAGSARVRGRGGRGADAIHANAKRTIPSRSNATVAQDHEERRRRVLRDAPQVRDDPRDGRPRRQRRAVEALRPADERGAGDTEAVMREKPPKKLQALKPVLKRAA